MKTALDFATFEVRDRVSINTGAGATWASLPAVIISMTPLQLELALRGTPADAETLAPGAMVRIQHVDRTVVRAQVVALDIAPNPVIVVNAIAAPIPEENNRSFHRMPVTLSETMMALLSPGRTVSTRARVLDLSGGGTRVLARKQVNTGDRVLIQLAIAGQQPVQVHADVVWVKPLRRFWLAGLRFVDLPVAIHATIQRAVFEAEVRLRLLR